MLQLFHLLWGHSTVVYISTLSYFLRILTFVMFYVIFFIIIPLANSGHCLTVICCLWIMHVYICVLVLYLYITTFIKDSFLYIILFDASIIFRIYAPKKFISIKICSNRNVPVKIQVWYEVKIGFGVLTQHVSQVLDQIFNENLIKSKIVNQWVAF